VTRLNQSKLPALVFLAAIFAAPCAWAETKIGVVDYGKLVEESPQAKTAMDAIRAEFTPKQREMENLANSLKSKQDKLDKDGPTMSADQLSETFLRSLAATVDLLVLCGGLGPTDDDITRDVVAEVFERPQAEDPAIVEHLRARYKARGYSGEMPRNNLRQAMVPRGAKVLPNPHGSAPGLWLEVDSQVVILLPGPPRELKPMFAALVDERLRPRTEGAGVFRSVLKVTGTIESQMDQQLHPLYDLWSAPEAAGLERQ